VSLGSESGENPPMTTRATSPVPVEFLDPRRLEPLVGADRIARLEETAARVRDLLAGRRVLNVNSTANGGGVAELLRTLLGYVRYTGIEAEWLVIQGSPEFFAVTKRIHNGLYGGPGDGLELDGRERREYERVLGENLPSLRAAVRAGDVVVVHDPQPAGLVPALLELGARVVWRCHVGIDKTNEWSQRAWTFIRRYVEPADAFVFSRREFAPPWLDASRLAVIPPSIDPFTPKNTELSPAETLGLLAGAGLVAGSHASDVRAARVVREGPAPGPDAPLVVQISRWDRMKDMGGVLRAFAEGVPTSSGAHLVLAGPAVDGVDDDPEALEVWSEVVSMWQSLPLADRSRVHLATIPMEDLVENARVVNALQRHAAVVAQKSLAEGFGLTVAEAMWKSRPVVASAVGGIVDQVVDGETGYLVDPGDLAGFAACVHHLLESPAEAERLGRNARERITAQFLADRHLLQYAELLERLIAT
jgi:trehalose synthase